MNKNDWNKKYTPDTVNVICENNGKSMEAQVIDLDDRRLVAAIQGVKITLASGNVKGVYTGRMGGLDLVYTRK
jgi:hypothetical protein